MLVSPISIFRTKLFFAFTFLMFLSSSTLFAQLNGNGNNNGNGTLGGNLLFNRIVGGVSIDPNGVIRNEAVRMAPDEVTSLRSLIGATEKGITKAGQRAISISSIENAIRESASEKKPLPIEVQFLGGLQRIEFVIAADNDLWLVGPGEGLMVTEDGQVIGADSGSPSLKLEDLTTALRSVENAREGFGISVDIRPTAEGLKKYTQLTKNLKVEQFDSAMVAKLEQAMGDQPITLTGIPTDSHFAQILARADYRMKRLSMGFEPAPIANFPSYIELIQDKNLKGTSAPRFWMECNYDAIAKSEDGNVWKLSGSGVKTLTEESIFDRDGNKVEGQKPRKNKMAEKWAETMTERFDELAAADPAFRELRNAMDMSVVAALIAKEGLFAKSNVSAPLLTENNITFSTPVWLAPKTVPSQCSFIRTTDGLSVTASGGVQIDSWAVASNQVVDNSLSKLAEKFKTAKTSFWMNLIP